MPYTPAHHFPADKKDPGFRSKLQIAGELARKAKQAAVAFRAVAADAAYSDHHSFLRDLDEAGLPFVVAVKPSHGSWSYGKDTYTPRLAAQALAWSDPEHRGDWTPVERTFRDGHTTTWWAAEASLGFWGPDVNVRLVAATTDPQTLPSQSTWYLATDLPRPGSPRAATSPQPPADLAEVVRIYGLRHWIEQSCKQDELGWADFQVRSDTAIRRHQTLVTCAFSFCWDTWFTPPVPAEEPEPDAPPERGLSRTPPAPHGLLAPSDPGRPWLADALAHAATLLVRLDDQAPTRRAKSLAQRPLPRTPA